MLGKITLLRLLRLFTGIGLHLLVTSNVAAQENIKSLAAEYLEVTDVRETLNHRVETSVDMLAAQYPNADKVKMRGILYETLGWDSLGGRITDLVARTYTTDELRAMIAFYKTPIGRATVLKTLHFSNEYDKLYSGAVQPALAKLEGVLEPPDEEAGILKEGEGVHWTEYKKIDSDDCVSIPFVGRTCHTVTYKIEFNGRISSVNHQAQEYIVLVTSRKVVPPEMVSPMYLVYRDRAQSWADQQTGRIMKFSDVE